MPNSVYEVLNNAKKVLSVAGVPDYNASAEVLLSAVLNVKRSQLALIREKKLSEKEIILFNSYIQRRVQREPAAYILGACGFMGFEFKVNKNVLIPRPETELLAEAVLSLSRGSLSGFPASALDLCTGSGCIAVSLSKLGNFKEICASDISEKALKTAEENAKINGAENITFLTGDLFSSVKGRKFDIIVSNPPYVSESEFADLEPELKYEPQTALTAGGDGLFFYKQIARQVRKYINSGGQILLELNANKSAEIKNIFSAAGFDDIKILKDYAGLDRILIIKET
jgi:release factor glutamine methyltransferase